MPCIEIDKPQVAYIFRKVMQDVPYIMAKSYLFHDKM